MSQKKSFTPKYRPGQRVRWSSIQDRSHVGEIVAFVPPGRVIPGVLNDNYRYDTKRWKQDLAKSKLIPEHMKIGARVSHFNGLLRKSTRPRYLVRSTTANRFCTPPAADFERHSHQMS